MKLVQALALSALVLFTAIRAHGDGVSTQDARIIIAGDPPPGTCNVALPSFMVNPQGNGGGKGDHEVGEADVGLTALVLPERLQTSLDGTHYPPGKHFSGRGPDP